jgi:hypothetical protein
MESQFVSRSDEKTKRRVVHRSCKIREQEWSLKMDRRDFLATIPLAAAGGAMSGSAFGSSEAKSFDEIPARASNDPLPENLDFASALQAAEAIRQKRVSSVELTKRVFERIDKYNPQLNAFAYQLRDDAMAQAKKADEAQAQGRSLGVFHGVPIHVKESYGVAGHPCTWGLPPMRDSKAPQNSDVVQKLLGTGAELIGATNVPVGLGDWQTYNPIYGTTNNPWDVKRTPSGSSGGTAAALAAGLGYLSMGSDIGGSIRVPASFCGLFGHKPTLARVLNLACGRRAYCSKCTRFDGGVKSCWRAGPLGCESLEVGDACASREELERVSRGLCDRRSYCSTDIRSESGFGKYDRQAVSRRGETSAGMAEGIQHVRVAGELSISPGRFSL